MTSRILVPLDLTGASRRALAVAATLGRQLNASIEAYLVMDGPYPIVDRDDAAAMAGAANCPLDDVVVLDSGHLAKTLAELAGDPDAMLCLASHGRSPVGELILGSVSSTVVREAPAPVMLVGPNCPDQPPPAFRNLVVGVDGEGPDTLRLLPEIERWTELGLHTWLLEVLPRRAPEARPFDTDEAATVREVAHLLRMASVSADWEVLHSRGADSRHVARTIIEFGDEVGGSIGLVAIHGRTGLRRLTLGSVALQLVHHAPWPIVIVPPPTEPMTSCSSAQKRSYPPERELRRGTVSVSATRPGGSSDV